MLFMAAMAKVIFNNKPLVCPLPRHFERELYVVDLRALRLLYRIRTLCKGLKNKITRFKVYRKKTTSFSCNKLRGLSNTPHRGVGTVEFDLFTLILRS